ncbi:MAG: MFS transporter, partial [Planctomycetota bacterium]
MSDSPRTAPDPNETGMPGGIPFIVGNEAAERFSYYGMRAILYVFMTEHLMGLDGSTDAMAPAEATVWQHNFIKACYAFPLIGAFLCDWKWGKYRTILGLSLLYCVGHAVMALCDAPGLTGIAPRWSLWAALALIALGSGGIKPCVSAHVGDQFGPSNKQLLPTVYGWFYLSINVGAALSTLVTPMLLDAFGPGVAFGLPGVLMALATLVFWLGRRRYVHVPAGGESFFAEATSSRGLMALANLLPLYAVLAVFWSLFDQTTSTWVEQAKHLDRNLLGWEVSPSQVQAANPILILILVPLFTYVVYPLVERGAATTPLRRIGAG